MPVRILVAMVGVILKENIMTEKEQGSLDGHYIIELFGHQKIAGYVKTVSLGGDCLLRVGVPEIKYQRGRIACKPPVEETIPAFTKFYNPKAVYSMSPVSAELCEKAMQSFRAEPINTFEFRQAALPAPDDTDTMDAGVDDDELAF
jgi:hypothetical protein